MAQCENMKMKYKLVKMLSPGLSDHFQIFKFSNFGIEKEAIYS